MKKTIMTRFELDNKKFVVNIALDEVKDAYHFFDRTTSFSKRDLDVEFVAYLIETVEEIGKHPFYLRIDLPKKKKSTTNEQKFIQSIRNYFTYDISLSNRSISKLLKKSIIHFSISIFFIVFSLILSLKIQHETLFNKLILEGVTIAAWVLMWPVFSDFFYDLISTMAHRKVLERIANTEIVFNYF